MSESRIKCFQEKISVSSEQSVQIRDSDKKCSNHKLISGIDMNQCCVKESQMDIPQTTWTPQLLDGSTHMRVRNDENTEDMLRNVLSGQVGLFFITDEKE